MASKRRLASRERDVQLAEAAYEERLLSALRVCAAGSWGLFGANDAVEATQSGKYATPHSAWTDLSERAEEINDLRASLGLEPFALHGRLLEYRRQAIDPNALGEPRLAQRFIDELSGEAASDKAALKAFY